MQVLEGADGPAEVDDELVVLHVAPLREVRHEEMVADQELAGRSLVLVEPEPCGDVAHHAGAPARVVVAVSLADVVEHHAEKEELRALDLAHHLGQVRHGLRELARPQAFELAHAHQRVVVDGVDVERVVRDQAVEVAELRDHGQENRPSSPPPD